MVVLGAVLGVILAALAAVLVSAVVASLLSAGAWALGVVVAVVLCLGLPALLERRLTRAFRKLQPDAGSMFFQTLGVVNAAWLAALLVLAPQRTRTALEQKGARLLPMLSQQQIERLAVAIPRSVGPMAPPGAVDKALSRPTASVAALPSSSSVATPSAAPVLVPTSSAIRTAPELETELETPAGKVYRERASAVVVLHTHIAVPKEGLLGKLYDKLGVSYGEGLGSGFIVDAQGLIVTNHHVIEGATSLQVVAQDGTHYEDVTLLRDEPKHDLALLSVSGKALSAAPLSKAKDVSVGARAIAIGCPLGFEYTLTEGIVSQLRNIDGTRFLQMQTAIAPGSSGGPLFDERGSIIGVNTATGGAAGVSLAVHFSEVAKLLAAPRSEQPFQRFVPGPRLAALETEGADLSPTDRMNVREGTSLLGHVALKCAKPLVDDAVVTVKLAAVTGSPRIETNLPSDARDCMAPIVTLLAMQLAAQLQRAAKPPSALLLTFVGIPREDGATGGLLYRFERP